MQIKQYAYGLMRIDDGASPTVVQDPGRDKFGKPIIYHYVAFGVTADNNANGNIQPMICIPEDGALYLNGEQIQINPPGGAVAGQILFPIGQGEVYCYVHVNNGRRVGEIVVGAGNVPNDAIASFKVAFVPQNLRTSRVTQFVYGSVFLYVDEGIFKIVEDTSSARAIQNLGARDSSAYEDDSSDSGEEYPPHDPSVFTRTHHFENCYYLLGEVLHEVSVSSSETVESFAGKFVCLKIPVTAGSSESDRLIGYSSVSALQEAQKDPAYVVKPLYKLDSSAHIEIDFRNGAQVQVAEVL